MRADSSLSVGCVVVLWCVDDPCWLLRVFVGVVSKVRGVLSVLCVCTWRCLRALRLFASAQLALRLRTLLAC